MCPGGMGQWVRLGGGEGGCVLLNTNTFKSLATQRQTAHACRRSPESAHRVQVGNGRYVGGGGVMLTAVQSEK